jgi:hypothetical protein
MIRTEGVNFKEMWKFGETVDMNSIYSNDIYAMLKTYGKYLMITVLLIVTRISL